MGSLHFIFWFSAAGLIRDIPEITLAGWYKKYIARRFFFRFRLSFEKCIFLKNEIQFDKFDGFYLMDHILN
jgi:hypothetical protein